MPPVGLEPTISVLESAQTLHASDRAGSVIGCSFAAIPRIPYLYPKGCFKKSVKCIFFPVAHSPYQFFGGWGGEFDQLTTLMLSTQQ
jgi:hypothetical protein